MNKSSKIIAAAAMVALLSTASVFAQGTPRRTRTPSVTSAVTTAVPSTPSRPQPVTTTPEKPVNCPRFMKNNHIINDTVIIGTVRSINTRTNTIKVVNSDNKEFEVKISAFSKVILASECPADNGPDTKQPEPASINELRTNDYVFITTYKTGTRIYEAASVLVDDRVSGSDNSNANAK